VPLFFSIHNTLQEFFHFRLCDSKPPPLTMLFSFSQSALARLLGFNVALFVTSEPDKHFTANSADPRRTLIKIAPPA
jgi:hypothetical protein